MKKRILATVCGILYLSFCIVLGVLLGEFALHPVRVPITRTPEALAMAAHFGAALENVSITSKDGTQLQGWIVRPKEITGQTVILFHGIGDNRQGMLQFARLFLAHGYSVLMPDSRGQGASGGLTTYGIKEKEDVHQWYYWLRDHEKAGSIFGMGESLGASIMLQAIKDVPFCAAIAESPFANFRDIAYIRVGQFFQTGPWLGQFLLRPAIEIAFAYCRLKYGVPLSSVSPARSVTGNKIPILLIHGLADRNIPPGQSEKIFKQCPNSISFWKVPNAGHCGAMNAAGAEFRERVPAWFRSHGGDSAGSAQ